MRKAYSFTVEDAERIGFKISPLLYALCLVRCFTSDLAYNSLVPSLAGPQEIDQIPTLLGCEFVLEGWHATEAEGDDLEDG